MDSVYYNIMNAAYQHFNDRNLDGLLSLMDPQVNFAHGWGGEVIIGHESLRVHWKKMWSEINPKVQALEIKEKEDGRIEVLVEQVVKDIEGHFLFDARVIHLFTIRNGLITNMEVLIPGWS